MADFDDIDALLSGSLKSAAEPANSAGVADLIRSRVAAGDTGTTVAGSTAPGWGGSSLGPVLGSIGLIVVAGAVGGVLGASGAFGSAQQAPIDTAIPAYVTSTDTTPTYLCPGGPETGTIPAGTRVLAVARDDAGAFLGVRDPGDFGSTTWLDVSRITIDAGVDTASLPVEECADDPVVVIEPEPTDEPTTEPTNPPTQNPQPPADTTAPVLSKLSATPTLIINGQPTLISVTASDNVAVTAVQLSWAVTGNNGSANMTLQAGVWRYSYSDSDLSDGFGNITFTARAVDAAGNLSAPLQVVVNRQYLG